MVADPTLIASVKGGVKVTTLKSTQGGGPIDVGGSGSRPVLGLRRFAEPLNHRRPDQIATRQSVVHPVSSLNCTSGKLQAT